MTVICSELGESRSVAMESDPHLHLCGLMKQLQAGYVCFQLYQHQHQGHQHQGDLETDKGSPPAPAADEEEERTRENGRKWRI